MYVVDCYVTNKVQLNDLIAGFPDTDVTFIFFTVSMIEY